MSKQVAKFLAYFVVMFVITFVFTGWMVLIWWSAQFGFWWNIAAIAFGFAVVSGFMLSLKDPAKVGK